MCLSRHEEDELQDVTVANGQQISDQGNQQGFTNGQMYTLIMPNVEDTPVKGNSLKRFIELMLYEMI